MQAQERSKMLGSMPMTQLVPKISVPIMISMLVQALYNVVDSIFVARFDARALTAVSLAMPVQMLMIAVCVGLATGINSLISRRLGEKRNDEARAAAWNGIFLELCGFLLFLIFGIFFTRPAFDALSNGLEAEVQEIIREYGYQYLGIVTTFSIGSFMAVVFERMMQSTGNTVLSMITQLSGAITNLILDPIMIFGLLGFPKLGAAGAAIATVIGQWVSMLVGFGINQKKNVELKLEMKEFALNTRSIRDILSVGLPSVVMQAISSVMNILLNMILIPYGSVAVNVLGVYFKLQSFVFMPVFGLSNGMVAIVGYNYGARLRARVYSAIRVALIYALVILGIGMLAFLVIPGALLSLFEQEGGDAALTAMGIPALRTISLCFLMAAVGITLSTVFQAVGKGSYSLIVSLCRQLLVLIPSAWLLSLIFGEVGAIWWSFVIAEGISMVISIALYRRVDRLLLKRLDT
ncbi:MAG: MATE family efflux transporter [Clostridia bacterium]|nr:MATE family efflux transporter [Clostridia bacterium]MBR2288460.1 MATE family efflux transporter [Clostridia bacterium]